MRKSLAITLTVTFLLVAAVLAQGPPQMPKPGEEHKKLDYFAGDWSSEGDIKPGPMGPGGKFTGTDHMKWMDGGYFIVIHSEGKMPAPMGNMKSLAVMGYNFQEKKYTYNGFNSMGEADQAMGTVEGDTWTFTNEVKMGDQMAKGRYIMKILSPKEYSFKFEMAPGGADFSTVMEGKATRK